VVKDVTLAVHRGETVAVVGESGSGKSTVARLICGLRPPVAGAIRFRGAVLPPQLRARSRDQLRRIQMIYQMPDMALNPRFNVGQIFTEPMEIHDIGATAQERTDLAFELLAKVGLAEVSFYKYPHEFSGGQRQRIAVARCLTMKPDILICDESVSALDVSVQAQVLNLLQDLQDEFGLSYIFISHDLAVVKYMSDQVMVMNDGEIVEIANSEEIYKHPKMPYTQRLLAAIPKGWHHS